MHYTRSPMNWLICDGAVLPGTKSLEAELKVFMEDPPKEVAAGLGGVLLLSNPSPDNLWVPIINS